MREPGYQEEILEPPPPYAVAAPPPVVVQPVVVQETPVVDVRETSSVAAINETLTSARFPSPTQILLGAVAGALLVFGIIAVASGVFPPAE